MEHEIIDVSAAEQTFRSSAGPVHACRGVDLRVRSGEVVALLGPNGAGKTTLLDMVLGLTRPTAGSVRVLGGDPRRAARTGRTGAVVQSGGLLGDVSVRETIAMIASTFGSLPVMGVDEALTRADLAGIARRRVSACSGGEQQRLRFALALLPRPELLVLDEPTTGMDTVARGEFWGVMHAEAESGRTVVFATHYLAEAEDFADRVVMMAEGRIVLDRPMAELRGGAGPRTLTATLPAERDRREEPDRPSEPEEDRADLLRDLRSIPGIGTTQITGDQLILHADLGPAADRAARHLLTRTGATDLAISVAGLTGVFERVTAPGGSGEATAGRRAAGARPDETPRVQEARR